MLQRRTRLGVPAVFIAGLVAAAPVSAQTTPDAGPAPALAYRSGAATSAAAQDFLFGTPNGTLSFRVGRLFARSDGEVHAHTFRNLTVEPRDLDALALGADLGFRLAGRVDAVFGAGFSRTSVRSEMRDWVDLDDEPIRQTTRFRQVPLTVGARLYVTPPGRSISQFAWIPARTALYVSGGVGLAHYAYEQEGEFVDEVDEIIFPDTLRSSGWAQLFYLGGGAELRVTRRAALVADVRYTHGSAHPDGDFGGLYDIGLGGLATSIGLALTF